MKYLICGFSGAGKSHLLKQLKESGEYSGYTFVDLDDFILAQNPEFSSLGALIQENGWEWFRNAEKDFLLQLLKTPNIWISLGGGALTEELANFLEHQEDLKVLWLDTDFEICWQRIKKDPNRPLTQEGRETLQGLYKQRGEIFKRFERLKT